MPRLVNAAEAAERVSEKHGIPLSELVDTFCDIATADAVPLVTCLDCKHYVWDEFDGSYACLSIGRFVNPDFWCANGERRVYDAYRT